MVEAELALVIVPVAGPEVLVQRYDDIVPSESVPVPFNETVFIGNVIVWLVPAFAVGGMLAALTVI